MSTLEDFINDCKNVELTEEEIQLGGKIPVKIQEVVDKHFPRFEPTGPRRGARGRGALWFGLGLGYGATQTERRVQTEGAITAHNNANPRYLIPKNYITINIPAGLIEPIGNSMVRNQWQFNQFIGYFGAWSAVYSLIAGSVAVVREADTLLYLSAFVASVVFINGITFNWRRVIVDGEEVSRQLIWHTEASWALPTPPPPPPSLPDDLVEKAIANDGEQQTRSEYIISKCFWYDGPGGKGYSLYAGAQALPERAQVEEKQIERQDGTFSTELFLDLFHDSLDGWNPVELAANKPLRCQAIKDSDKKRCSLMVHADQRNGPFCGVHEGWRTNGKERADNWAVDIIVLDAEDTLGPNEAVVEYAKNNLRF